MSVDPSGKTLAEWHHRQKLVLPARMQSGAGFSFGAFGQFLIYLPARLGHSAWSLQERLFHEILHIHDLELLKSFRIQ
ncbi:hypothetical protein [Bradyrhizobium sp. RP6]|uniref:hypothetical protein n=1 Tax=unclassified Bradyrhizobium TaxID=2631580 RepID=UPI000F52C72B|nr:hypothetical protein [Bradyrhizobium sp. RP6]RQH10414.1 hypothetical protein EHH60_23160 [Bradyrhizobium sp. RP6]